MKETKEIKKSRNITFRLTGDEYSRIEKPPPRQAMTRILGAGSWHLVNSAKVLPSQRMNG